VKKPRPDRWTRQLARYRGPVTEAAVPESAVPDSAEAPVRILVEGRLGRITLNRPRQINALTLPMIGAIRAALARWRDDAAVDVVLIDGAGDRGLCAGADIRALRLSILDGTGEAMTFLADEYDMNATLAGYPKPIVALQRGITFGGGLGVSAHCSTRIVTQDSLLAMPETLIGLWPDVGMLYRLSRAPGQLGVHAALVGARLDAGDAIRAGLADRFVPAAALGSFVEALRSGVLPEVADEQPSGTLADATWIDECYAFDTAEEILAALLAHPDPAAREAGRALGGMAPTSVKVTLRAVRAAASMTLQQVLDQDLRFARHFMTRPDLPEGVRAQVVDKDRSPRWRPARLEDVTEDDVAAFFA
jgi:enoyl-CoA hydratase